MATVPFNQRVEKEIQEIFEELADILPGRKGDLLAAAIRGLNALPEQLQFKLLSGDPANREMVLELLAALQIPVEPARRAQQSKKAKFGG